MRIAFLLACILATGAPAMAQGSAAKKAADPKDSEPAQTFVSPLPIGAGASLLLNKASTTVSAAVSSQLARGVINFWQFGVSGTIDDSGKSLTFSSSDKGSPGWKAKLGVGHSSFRLPPHSAFEAAMTAMANEAWCLDVVAAENDRLKTTGADLNNPVSCSVARDAVRQAMKDDPPQKADKTDDDLVKAINKVLDQFSPSGGAMPNQSSVCAWLKQNDNDVFKSTCPDGGAVIVRGNDLHDKYPRMFDSVVGNATIPAFYYKASLNWTPSLLSVNYRDLVNGAPDLATPNHSTRLLEGGAFDYMIYYRKFVAGIEVSYSDVVDVKLSSICNTTTQGTFSSQDCSDAMLGAPKAYRAIGYTATLALDPLILPSADASMRPGAQLSLHYEAPTKGTGHKVEISLPIYLAPVESPMKLVFGVRPTWTNDTVTGKGRTFAVYLFAGARP